MRRLRNSRSPDPDELGAEGFDRSDLEGEAIGPAADEIPWLRPFGADVPGALLAEPAAPEGEGDGGGGILHQAGELARGGRRLDAALLLQRALGEGLSDPAARALLADLHEQGGDTEAALAELSRAIEAAGDPVPLMVRRGELLARVGQSSEADRDLREAVRRRPDYGPGHFHLGVSLLRRGRAADAAESLREALRIAPDQGAAHYHLGEALEALGDLTGALGALERAAELLHRDGRAYKLMGRLLDRLGRTEDAMAMHRKAREASIR